ncbi:hypothetical protein [Pontivivens insulae]|uniref:AB hydrolase-1 domain-containing protein n=1 Tax=Pontivivens insulae TaxID=1639689 RepID=A0A2R8A996_9RHOB|nr:hypothetical protein [Pontivivens insulae]SPF28786.1 hypothetical protein POI8812_01089 [Pontivivens insulae]
MSLMGLRLEREGFTTFTAGYASRSDTMAEAQAKLLAQIAVKAPDGCHIVGHSLGGVLGLRIKAAEPERFGRVVQLGSPNKGSPMAAFFKDMPMVPQIMGPVMERLAAADLGLDALPPNIARDLGIIAGSAAPMERISPYWGIEGPSDGMVPLESALGIDHADALLTTTLHGVLPLSSHAAEQVAHFLRDGRFRRDEVAA